MTKKPTKKPTKPTGGAAMASAKPEKYIDSPRAQMLNYIKAKPGSRAEELPPLFDKETKSRSGTLRSLRATGHVRSTGRARGTKYFTTKKQLKTA